MKNTAEKMPINLWRTKNVELSITDFKPNDQVIQTIFPSARQALRAALIKAGVNRHSRIALPDWTTECLVGTISKVATPIPIREVLQYSIPIKGVLLYEQWGWPILPSLKEKIINSVNTEIIILDRVDSPYIETNGKITFFPEFQEIELFSFSKVLGTKGGGIVKHNSEYVEFNLDIEKQRFCERFFCETNISQIQDEIIHFYKNELPVHHPELKTFYSSNDIVQCYQFEQNERRKRIEVILKSKLACCWEKWMFKAIELGGSPGIVPLFKDESNEKLEKIICFLKEKYNIRTSIYHFNWSGNPISPDYKRCCAFPVHGMVDLIDDIVNDLIKYFY